MVRSEGVDRFAGAGSFGAAGSVTGADLLFDSSNLTVGQTNAPAYVDTDSGTRRPALVLDLCFGNVWMDHSRLFGSCACRQRTTPADRLTAEKEA